MGFNSQTGQVGFKTQPAAGTYIDPGGAPADVNEIQTLTGTAVSAGTYTLTFDGQTTSALAFDALTAAIQAALDALPNLDTGDVVVTGGPISTTPVVLTFGEDYAGVNVPMVVVDATALTGTIAVVQSTPGSGGAGVFMRLRTGALEVKRELIKPDREVGGNRHQSAAHLGPVVFAGEYSAYARMEALATIIAAALGSVDSTHVGEGATLVGTHVITAGDSLPWLSIEEAVSSFDVFRYTDAKVNSVKLEVDPAGYLTVSFGLIAKTQTDGATKTATPDWDTTPMIVGTNVTISYKGTALPAKSLSLEINNNIEDNDFRLGSIFVGDLTEKGFTVNGSVKVRPVDKDIWRAATYGDAAATTPEGGPADQGAVVMAFTSYEVIGSSATPYSMAVSLPVVVLSPIALSASGDDVIEHDVPWEAIRPDTAAQLITCTIVNGLATVL